MRFAHIADCHLGCWRQPELQELSVKAFNYAIDECIKENVNFVLITGDLFDSAMPPVEILKEAASKLSELKKKNIDCYIIPGSHDFSVSGKTFLDVFEKAGLFVNVARYEETENETKIEFFRKNGLILAGIPGKKAGLEKNIIEKIKYGNNEKGFKILCLHTTLTEAKPKDMEFIDSVDSEKLPNGFDYYAFGHLHEFFNKNIKGKICVYPGPLIPANFVEFEDIKNGSFCIVSYDNKINVEKREIKLKDTMSLIIDAESKSPEQVTEEILQKIEKVNNEIITLRIRGTLSRGKTSDIAFEKISEIVLKNKNVLLKNTTFLKSPEFKAEIEAEGKDIDEIENEVIKKYGKKDEFLEFFSIIENLMHSLEAEKQEGETNTTFEGRLMDEVNKVFEI